MWRAGLKFICPVDVQIHLHHLLWRLSFLHWIACTFVKNHLEYSWSLFCSLLSSGILNSLTSLNKSWYMLIFIYCGIMFASIFWRIFLHLYTWGTSVCISCTVFVWLWYHNISFIRQPEVPPSFFFWRRWYRVGVISLNIAEFSSITIWAQILHFGVLLNENFSFLNSYWAIQIICFMLSCVVCVFWEIGPFHLNCQIYMHIVFQSIFLWVFWCSRVCSDNLFLIP